ncbi:MAG: hypothetical protein ACRD0P_23275 [Stackebrandtia sp.]
MPSTGRRRTSVDGENHQRVPVWAFDVTVVDGEEGRRLAGLQAQALLDVLSWFYERATSSHTSSGVAVEARDSGGNGQNGSA